MFHFICIVTVKCAVIMQLTKFALKMFGNALYNLHATLGSTANYCAAFFYL